MTVETIGTALAETMAEAVVAIRSAAGADFPTPEDVGREIDAKIDRLAVEIVGRLVALALAPSPQP